MSQGPRYEIKDLIAAGGMAEVYRGESSGIEGFRKKVAIKRVLPKLSANQDFINMFLDEARLCAYLNHSRCVQVFDIGQGAGSHFIVMEYVDGADLKGVLDYLARNKQVMRAEVAILITLNICEGLSYAHQACDHNGHPLEIVHRDISPHNVLMTRHGEVKLVDFGLARASSHLTSEDEDIVKGKFGYLAPEITDRLRVDHRVDVFAAGILLWEMLAGRRLFLGKTDLDTFKQVKAAQVPDLRQVRRDVTDGLWSVIQKALCRDRDQRYQTAAEFARDLATLLTKTSHPVTFEDIGAVVELAAKERKPSKTRSTKKVLGELILETLHDFSDVEEDTETDLNPSADNARAPSYEDPTAWDLGFDADSMAPLAPSLPSPRLPGPPLPQPPVQLSMRPDGTPSATPPSSRSARQRASVPPPPKDPSGPWWRRWFD